MDSELVEETPPTQEETPAQGGKDSLIKLLSIPFSALSQRLKRTALDLKETAVIETWGLIGQHVRDFTLYSESGVLGTTYLLAYLVTANKTDLGLCSEIVKACDSTSFGSKDITFICGRAGVCALGAVVVKYSGDERLMNYYLSRFNEIKLPRSLPDELLYGRVGFLWACLFLNKHIGQGTVPPTYTGAVVSEIIKNGIRLANKGRCPLMFEWYGEKYWGAAHGLVGIMHVLMRMELIIDEKEMLKHRGCCSFSHDVMSKVPSSRLWGCFK
ncbi:lanC-like protein GCL2 [Vitis vinifera]|nr:lanC-like protein GCL2 [Vitis vinifera]|eukprot:XP_010661310.1 PREDICTED: lanC-like protein GCL2 [Vitis vinifera]